MTKWGIWCHINHDWVEDGVTKNDDGTYNPVYSRFDSKKEAVDEAKDMNSIAKGKTYEARKFGRRH